jgi:hypothetical protein
LGTDVAELPVLDCRIDVVPEVVEQLLIGNLVRIVDAHRFRMTSAAMADLFVGWVLDLSSGVTRLGVRHAWKLFEVRFYAPEAPTSEEGRG